MSGAIIREALLMVTRRALQHRFGRHSHSYETRPIPTDEAVVPIERARANAAAAGVRVERSAEFRERFASPYVAAERGYIDAVIEPRSTRPKLIAALRMLDNKTDTMPRKKHGNIPL